MKDWHNTASVRTAAKISLSNIDEPFYPARKQPLVTHSLIKHDPAITQRILIQSCYQYMYEITLLETQFVISLALKIINKDSVYPFTDQQRQNAISILIDEGYHAYVASDFIAQLKEKTGIQPLHVPTSNRNLDAVARTCSKLPKAMHTTFEFIAVCLAEHTLTNSFIDEHDDSMVHSAFNQIVNAHIADEKHHARYFFSLLPIFWEQLDATAKKIILSELPMFIDDYLSWDKERNFDIALLEDVGFSSIEIDLIINETQDRYVAKSKEYETQAKSRLNTVLRKSGVYSF